MLYFKIALRRLRSDKIYSLINITGLSIGLAVSVMVFRYAHYELRYDSFFTNADRIYRVSTEMFEDHQLVYRSALCSQQVGPRLKNNFADTEQVVQLLSTANWFVCTLKYAHGAESKMFNESGVFYTDSEFFGTFNWPLIEGDVDNVLKLPLSAVITESTAYRYFGHEPAIGKVLHLQGSVEDNDYTVTGVMPDLPDDSHLVISVLFSANSLEHNAYAKNFECYTYFRSARGTDIQQLNDKLNKPSDADPNATLQLLPVTSIHHDTRWQEEMKPSGNQKAVFFLMIVAAFVLIIALINYVNLATGRALERAREVGVRKISGAHRSQLMAQFLSESAIIYVSSIVVAGVLIMIAANNIPGMMLANRFVMTESMPWLVGAGFVLLLFLAAWYPARMISSFDPALVLKGKFMGSQKGLILRRSLVILQFVCAIALMTGVIVMHDQYDFMQKQDLGFEKSGMLIIRAPSTVIDETAYDKIPEFKKKLEQLSFVQSVSTSSNIPGQRLGWTANLKRFKDQPVVGRNFTVQLIDPDFIRSYGVRLVAGKNLSETDFPRSRRFGSKVENLLFNEKAIKQLGYASPEEAIGKTIYWDDNVCVIAGVVSDFHQESLQNPIAPALFSANVGASMTIRLQKSNQASDLSIIKTSWVSFFPDCPFDYFFLDDFFAHQYVDDLQMVRLFDGFCVLAILISALGLFGLSLFATRQRMKELSIRKVLGANFQNLVALLFREFLWPVMLACVLAIPFLIFFLQQWLNRFAYHTELSMMQFILPMLMVLAIAIVTVGFQTLKAAIANPVDLLRQE